MAGEASFSSTVNRAGTWLTSLGQRSRTTTSAATSTMSRVFQPRNTTSIILSKGLLNAPGENNCFLNSAVQVLWHLDVFRRSFRDMAGHACMGKSCIFCALKVLFTQLQYGEEKALPPDALRKALASAFKDEQRFQLGCMDDAAECFENILVRIHFHLAHDIKEDMCDAKHCLSHRKFAMTLIEHCVCPCGATSEPFPFTQMVHYVSCTALCGEAKLRREKHHLSSAFFGQLLRSAGAIGDIRECPSECGRKIHIRRVLMNCPDVVGVGLVWDSDRPSVDHIMDVISCLGTTLRLPDLFNSAVDEQAKKIALNLVGVVTYYGKHYSTFFYNTKRRLWIYFDDASVKQVGPNWRDVAERCRRGHFQPLLLLYANPNGLAVDISTAPKDTTILPGYQHPDKESPDKPMMSKSYPSTHQYRKSSHPKTTSHSGGSLESTGAVYKSLAAVPEFEASSQAPVSPGYDQRDWMNPAFRSLNSVVEIGQDPLHDVSQGRGQYPSRTEPLSVDGGERTTHETSTLVRENQKKALAMAGFACTQQYEQRSKPADAREHIDTRDKTLEMAGFIESSGTPQPLISGNYSGKTYSSRSNLVTRTAEPSDLMGQHDVNPYVSADGNKSLPRHQQGALLPQASRTSTTGVKYPQSYRKPQNGGGAAPHTPSEPNRTLFEFESTGQKRQLVRHQSWNGRTANSKSIPIYENVVNGNVATDDTDSAEGNVTSQGRHSRYSSVPDLQRRLSDPIARTSQQQGNEQRTRHMSDNQFREKPNGQNIGMYDSVQGLQNQLGSFKLDGAKAATVGTNKPAGVTDIYSSMPDLQRSTESKSATQNSAQKGLLADAIRNNNEHRKTLERVASNSSMSSLASSLGKELDSKRSSQASVASTFTTDSADTSRSGGSRSGPSASLRNKYVASGFVTLPRKKRISDFANDGRSDQQTKPWFQRSDGPRGSVHRSHSEPAPAPVVHMAPRLQQQNSAPSQFAGVFVDEDDAPSAASPTATGATTTTAARRPSHLQHFTTTSSVEATTAKSDPLEVGSVGSKDSGYRSRDRSSASSGSVYSVDSPVAETSPQFGDQHSQFAGTHGTAETYRGGSTSPTSPSVARKQEIEALCVAVCIDVEELLDKCHRQEMEGDLATALCMCTTAVTKLKSTLRQDGISEKTRHFLQTKYSTTVLKSRSLHRRLQIVRKQERQDSIDAPEPPTDTRPTTDSVPISTQPTRPCSTQPISSTKPQYDRPASVQPLSQYQQYYQPTAVAVDIPIHRTQSSQHATRTSSQSAHIQNGSANGDVSHSRDSRSGANIQPGHSHATDPRTGMYRPHSAQLPRKQYEFNNQGLQRLPSNGYQHQKEMHDGERGDEAWRSASTVGRNPPRRTVVDTLNQSQEPMCEDPSSLSPYGGDSTDTPARDLFNRELSQKESPSRELPSRGLPIKESSNSSPVNNLVRIIRSQPANIHTDIQFTQTPIATLNQEHISSKETSNSVANVNRTADQLKASVERNLSDLCSSVPQTGASVQYNTTLPHKGAPSNRKDRRVTYVISVTSVTKSTEGNPNKKQNAIVYSP